MLLDFAMLIQVTDGYCHMGIGIVCQDVEFQIIKAADIGDGGEINIEGGVTDGLIGTKGIGILAAVIYAGFG